MATYKFRIEEKANGSHHVSFMYGGEKIFFSEAFTTKVAAYNNISSSRSNSGAPIVDTTIGETGTGERYEIKAGSGTKAAEYYVRFFAENGEMLSHTEHYTAKHNAKNAIAAMKSNAKSATIDDQTSSKAA